MALEIFCQIDKIACESNVKNYEKWFKVEQFSVAGSYSFDPRNETGAGTTDLSPISIGKIMDKSSALIAEAVLYKLKVAKVVVEIMNDKPGGSGGRAKHLTYTFENCRITSFQQSASDPMHEVFTLAYRIIKFDDHFTGQKMQYDLSKPDEKKGL
jgi:type VI protein secretion system component Hcp